MVHIQDRAGHLPIEKSYAHVDKQEGGSTT